MNEKTKLFYKLVKINDKNGWGENQASALAEMIAKLTDDEAAQYGNAFQDAMRDGGFKAFCAKRREVLRMDVV